MMPATAMICRDFSLRLPLRRHCLCACDASQQHFQRVSARCAKERSAHVPRRADARSEAVLERLRAPRKDAHFRGA